MAFSKKFSVFFLIFIVLAFAPAVFSSQLMSLHGQFTSSGSLLSSGDLRVYIYDAASAGNLVYDSGTDFDNTVSNGIVDVMLGSGAASLDLNYGTHYYLDLSVEGTDLDFGGSERKEFEASTGNVLGANIASGAISNSNVASNAAIDWTKISKTGSTLSELGWSSDFNSVYNRKGSNETVSGNWDFTGATNFSNGFGSGGATIQNGILYVQSIVVLNDLNAATLTPIDMNGNYQPLVNNQWNLGSSARRWAGIYGVDVNSNAATIGTLTLANPLGLANGGTGNTAFTTGRVPFSNGTILTSDGNFFWDNANKRLGIGTTNPQNAFNVLGDINLSTGRICNDVNCYLLEDLNASASSQWTTNGTRIFYPSSVGGDGNVGINTTTPSYRLDVNGNTRIRGDLNIANPYTSTFSKSIGAYPNTFSPEMLPNLALWLKADSLNLSQGAAVSTWTDSSGNGNDVNQNTAARRPTYDANGPNGMPTVRFLDANSQYLATATTFFSSAYDYNFTMFIVARHNTLSASTDCLFGEASGTVHYCYTTSPDRWKFDVPIAHDILAARNMDTNNFTIHTLTYSQTNPLMRQNGVELTSVKRTDRIGSYSSGIMQNPSALNATGALSIGAVSASFTYGGDISEVIVYNSPLSNSDIRLVENYLSNKYSLNHGNIIFFGDSQVYSAGASDINGNFPAQTMKLLDSNSWHPINAGANGDSAFGANLEELSNLYASFRNNHDVAVVWIGINDLTFSIGSTTQQAAVTYPRIVNFAGGLRRAGYKVIVFTYLPNNFSGHPANFETQRLLLTSMIRDNWPKFADALVDVAAIPNLGATGDADDTNYFSDNVHLSALGNSLVAAKVADAIRRISNPLNNNSIWATSDGNVGINTISPAFPFDVNGTSRIIGDLNLAGRLFVGYSAIQSDGNVGINLATIVTVEAPASANATVIYGTGDMSNSGYCFQYRVYAFKTVGAGRAYSPTAADTGQVCDDGGNDNAEYVEVSWSAVSGADGYRVVFYNDYTANNFDNSYDISAPTITLNDGDGTLSSNGDAGVSPTFAISGFIPAKNRLNIMGDANILTSLTSTRPSLLIHSPDGNIGINTAGGAGYRFDVNGNTRIVGDVNFSTRTIVRSDGNLTMTSPNGTRFNCGLSTGNVFLCS